LKELAGTTGLEPAASAVLAHEAIIDSVRDTNIRPLLMKRFPDATAEQLKEAHGYAVRWGDYPGHGLLTLKIFSWIFNISATCSTTGSMAGRLRVHLAATHSLRNAVSGAQMIAACL